MVFCNNAYVVIESKIGLVTILILIDGFLQFNYNKNYIKQDIGHNPYFNRWFSAM